MVKPRGKSWLAAALRNKTEAVRQRPPVLESKTAENCITLPLDHKRTVAWSWGWSWLSSTVVAGERASGESPHLFHQHHAQQEHRRWNRGSLEGPEWRPHDSGSSGVWFGPGQAQREVERSQRRLWFDSLLPSVLKDSKGGRPSVWFLQIYTCSNVWDFAITWFTLQTWTQGFLTTVSFSFLLFIMFWI